ncbi:hypothetical protein PENANT_c017G10299 [Penicillium antarcticum]|uniref:Alpha/beta hydrolase fold-3 domain-containing protein n=1 Tax=Penicillium antarcticum TaxID=416450 RepID=A0A1V6Q1Z5_9EURO|nr:uncharacterized protein N7508_005361 [Penicillium antarcticum]KAJ5306346.1 hypothetical protein N7508_005361 [Penicillium antarcticum]OQD83263.1 hypothetical protein PENANT_c017G10299 [Penicillium antarcticum]
MSILSYWRDKCLAVILRFLVGLVARVHATPDEVRQIKSRDAGRSIRVHVYRSSSTGPSPVLLNWHGSGFLLPHHGSDDEFCRQVSRETKYAVLDCAYRLAPEHPFPAALNDVEDAIKYVLARPNEFDLTHVSLSGFSAGGNLALAAAANLFPTDTFHSLLAYYPVTDLSTDGSKKSTPVDKGRAIPVFIGRLFNRCYIPSTFDRRDPRISPLFARADQFPQRLLMITADMDSLALEAEKLAQKIEESPGRHVVSQRMADCTHAWDKRTRAGTPRHAAKELAYKLAVDMLNTE